MLSQMVVVAYYFETEFVAVVYSFEVVGTFDSEVAVEADNFEWKNSVIQV